MNNFNISSLSNDFQILPFFINKHLLHFFIILFLCAIIIVVILDFCIILSIVSSISFSLLLSKPLVYSSKINILGFFKIALAIKIFWICPADNSSYSFLLSPALDSLFEIISSNPHNLITLLISSSVAFKLEYLIYYHK